MVLVTSERNLQTNHGLAPQSYLPVLPGLHELWAETLGDPRLCVAVLDGPADLSHPCFTGADLKVLETLLSGEADRGAASQHGTHVASLIFGQPGSSVQGIAPRCRGLILPVFGNGAGGGLAPCSQLDLARAIAQAVAEGADVINVSGGQLEPSGEGQALLASAVRLCSSSGILIVAAAGNQGCECLQVPAALPSVLAVGAMDADGSPLPFSNWGEAYRRQGVLAPGQLILGAFPGGGTTLQSGTSYATPLVTGIAALLLSLQLKWGRRPDVGVVRDAILRGAIGCAEQPVAECNRLLMGRIHIPRALILLRKGGSMETSDANGGQEQPSEVQSQHAAGAVENTDPPLAGTPPRVHAAGLMDPPAPPLSLPPGSAPEPRSEAPGRVMASGCGGQPQALAYVLGQLGVDFVTEARRDSLVQHGLANPYDTAELLRFLTANPPFATAVTWVLAQESTPIYAIQPGGAFAAEIYETLRNFLQSQFSEGVERVSLPGWVMGKADLLSGQSVPILWPELRGMYSWSTPALVRAVLGDAPAEKDNLDTFHTRTAEITSFLERVYYEIRNLGLAPQERAINFAATNAFQVERVYQSALQAELKLDSITVERSPICRPDSDCWDVKLTFFNPAKRLEQARAVYRFTVDVSDVVPVTVGKVRHWEVY